MENNNNSNTIDEYTKKHITILEQENERLKNQIGNQLIFAIFHKNKKKQTPQNLMIFGI